MRSPPADPIRVLIAAPQPLFRSGLRTMIEAEDMRVVAEAGTGADALDLVAGLRPDVVLVDAELPDLPGRELTLRLAELAPGARAVALLARTDPDEVLDALQGGAHGYLPKDESVQTLVGGIIRAAVAGLPLLSARTTRALLDRLRERQVGQAHGNAIKAALSERELEVLALIADGRDNAAIAAALFISRDTVKHHVHNILAKLGVENRVQAAVAAVRAGLV